jgi:hypothetical protein
MSIWRSTASAAITKDGRQHGLAVVLSTHSERKKSTSSSSAFPEMVPGPDGSWTELTIHGQVSFFSFFSVLLFFSFSIFYFVF